jgi:hypothetical protein
LQSEFVGFRFWKTNFSNSTNNDEWSETFNIVPFEKVGRVFARVLFMKNLKFEHLSTPWKKCLLMKLFVVVFAR